MDHGSSQVKRFLLIREKSDGERTFGALYDKGKFVCHTMEPGDDDIEAPRVNPGFYALEPHGWKDGDPVKYKKTWALVGDGVSHWPEGEGRSAVLFHAGNWDEQTRGCVLVGLDRGEMRGEPALLNSGAAMSQLRAIIGGPYYAGLIIRG